MFALALLALVLTLTMVPAGSGVNFGTGFAIIAILSAGVAGSLGLYAQQHSRFQSFDPLLAFVIGILALLVAGAMIVFVRLGIKDLQ